MGASKCGCRSTRRASGFHVVIGKTWRYTVLNAHTFPSFPLGSTRAVDIVLTLSPSEMVARCRDYSRSVEVTIFATAQNPLLPSRTTMSKAPLQSIFSITS